MSTPTVWVALDNHNYLHIFAKEPVWKTGVMVQGYGATYTGWWPSEDDNSDPTELPLHYAATLDLKPGQKVECKLFAIGAFKNHEPN